MDTLSHGLWGGVAFGRKNKKSFWLAFSIGIAPDIFSFGVLFLSFLFSRETNFRSGPPDPSLIPVYIDQLYNFTHSLVIFALVFFICWIIFQRPIMEILAWGIHIILDMFTHSFDFFPTPFLWPVSDFKINGNSWSEPWIFIPNVISLLIFYYWFFISKRKK